MEPMRISLTVLPVGPHGRDRLDATPKLTFALQATAGYEPDGQNGELQALWPWTFLVPNSDGCIPVSAWLGKDNGGNADIRSIAVELVDCDSQLPFIKSLQGYIERSYENGEDKLNLELYFPSELADKAQEIGTNEVARLVEKNFPSRASYLSSLPGELSRRLLSTVYFRIDRDLLFEKDAQGEWQVKDGYEVIWVVPDAISRNDNRYPIVGDPELVPTLPDLWMQGYDGDQTHVFGPGYELGRYLETDSTLFDLDTYWLPVSQGDARFTELESFLLKVIEPLSETRRIPLLALRGALKSETNRVLAEEELQLTHLLWQVQSLAKEIDWETGIVKEALRRLFISFNRDVDPDEMVKQVDASWQVKSTPDLLETMGNMAPLIGVSAQILADGSVDQRMLVKNVSKQATIDGLCSYLERVFESLHDEDSLSTIAEDWSFPGSKSNQVIERRRARVHLALEEAIENIHVAELLGRLENNPSDVISELRDVGVQQELLGKRWVARLSEPIATALKDLDFDDIGRSLVLDSDTIEALAMDYLDNVWPQETDNTEAAGRPIEIVLGSTKLRLVHELNQKLPGTVRGGDDGIFNEVTGHTLLVRRHETENGVLTAPWRLVSGGVVTIGRPEGIFIPLDDSDDWLPELLPIAEENVFLHGLLRADRGYDGQLRHVQSPLELAYAHAGGITESTGISFDSTYTYHGLGQYKGQNADIRAMANILKAPPLRFGDWYQFAASIVDAAGGIAAEIALNDAPWRIDMSKVSGTDDMPASSVPIPFRRRQPVGEVNLLPETGVKNWPLTPPGVVLRAREWQRALRTDSEGESPGNDNVPEILLWQGSNFSEDERPTFVAELEPPSIDEFTLRRWVTPPYSAPNDEKNSIKSKLTKALVNLYEHRRSETFDPRSMVHDPAVLAIGFRVQVFNQLGKRILDQDKISKLGESNLPYRNKRIRIEISIAPGATEGTIKAEIDSADTKHLKLSLPLGWFTSIDAWSLVTREDFDSRFAPVALFGNVIESGKYPGSDEYVAFQPSRLLVEVASDQLPRRDVLYNGLKLNREGNHVRVSWSGADDALQMVDRFTLHRDRWQWRNRPVFSKLESIPNEAEKSRLAASGLPSDAFDPSNRDESGEVREWESIAQLDRGFVRRGLHSGVWPRMTPLR